MTDTGAAAQPPRLEEAVREWARSMPDAIAAESIGTDRRITWAELDDSSDRLVSVLLDRGVRPGDRVAWLGSNDPAFLPIVVACRRVRAALVGLNWRLSSTDLERQAAAVGPALTIGLAPMLADVDLGPHLGVPTDGPFPWADRPRGEALVPEPDDPTIMFFTSGSTGEPKAVRISRRSIDLAVSESTAFTFHAGDRMLVVPPQFHLAGATWCQYGLLYGVTQYYTADASPAGLVRALADQQITHAVMVPALLHMIVGELNSNPTPLPHLGDIAYGASPISGALLRELARVMPCRFTQVYGLSESGGAIVELPPADHHPDSPRLLAAGRPVNATRVRIVDVTTGADVPVGTAGEIVVASDHLMTGYWGRDDVTETVLRDGWLHTRDVGRVDADGYVYVEGRVDDMIITGGENVQPAAVEQVLAEMDGVSECAVFGVADDLWGTRICAAVVPRPGSQIDPEATIAWLRQRLAGYQTPKTVVVVEHLPRSATGKLVRRDLAAFVRPEGEQ